MHPVELLLETAVADSQLLHHNINSGDVMWKPRDLDFVFYSPERQKVETVASFVTDNRYGEPSIEPTELENGKPGFRLLVVVHAPATHTIVHSISGLMCMLGALFDIEYDGWGCELQRPTPPPADAGPPPGNAGSSPGNAAPPPLPPGRPSTPPPLPRG